MRQLRKSLTLHPNAYRDIFINDTIAYIIVYVGILIYKNISKRKK
ncbi:DUF6608 family protein [Acetivibrio ethanolgignens]